MPAIWEPLSGPAATLATAAARRVLAAPGPFLDQVDAAVIGAAGPLADDPDLREWALITNHANVTRWLAATAQRPGAPVGQEPTPEALEVGREFVRRGIDREVLWTAYRQGQNELWRAWMAATAAEAARTGAGDAVLAEALDGTARSLFAYIDDVLRNVEAQVERERESLRGGHAARRLETVQLVLQGAPIPEERAGGRLGYDLAGRHVALVLWQDAGAHDAGRLERTASLLARAAGAPRALTVPAGTSTAWAWMTVPAAPSPDRLRAALAGEDGVGVAAGSWSPGAAGFRRSHQDALDVQRLVRGRPGAPALVTYAEVEVAVVASADPARAAEFVRSTLGALAAADPVLRQTLRVLLEEQGSATHAAERLFTHRNTVLKRVARAEALMPAPWRERPLAVGLALELDHWR